MPESPHTPDGAFGRAAARRRMDGLESEILALEDSLRTLKVERESLKTYLEAYNYPVLALPNEIVSEIFHHNGDPDDLEPSDPASPLFLGHICQKWREIALSAPRLWTSIVVTLDESDFHEGQLQLLGVWLSRSRDFPLNIFLNDTRYYPAFSVANRFVPSIVPHCKRLEHARFSLPLRDLILLSEGDMPLLHRASIEIRDLADSRRSVYFSPPVRLFHHAPKLQQVDITGLFDPRFVPLPWAQLTTLSIRSSYVHDFLDTLRFAQQVQHVTADNLGASPDEMIGITPNVPPLLHLHTLVILGLITHLAPYPQFLDKLTLPALRRLSLFQACWLFFRVDFENLISRSGSRLPDVEIELTKVVHKPRSSSPSGSDDSSAGEEEEEDGESGDNTEDETSDESEG
ncbi:hypothetical protein C8R43DRAFT_1057454 [Mycena crocata]|nr:hypothetical protein C8R43DRAFT_1057454 [Mycena crocata]